MAEVSVIVPTLNEENYIGKCLDAFVKQTIELEIIIVDGNSKDKTREIAKNYTDKVYNYKKPGIGPARVYGTKKARSKYFYMTDADSFPPRDDLLEDMLARFKNNIIAVTGPTRYIGSRTAKLAELWYYLMDKYLFSIMFHVRYGLSGRNTIINRKIFLKSIKGKQIPLLWEDGFFSMCLYKYGNFVYDNKLFNISFDRRFNDIKCFLDTVYTYIKAKKELERTGTIKNVRLPEPKKPSAQHP